MSNSLQINDFKTRLVGGGARPNLFRITLEPTGPAGAGTAIVEAANDLGFFCKAAQLPGSTVGSIDVPYRGRILKVAGDRTFEPWTITVINDTNFRIRHAFETWMNRINEITNNGGIVNPNTYQADGSVTQYGRSSGAGTGTVLRTYNFQGMFPTNISPIDLSYDSSDTIEEFTVELQVQFFTIADGPGAIT